MDVDKTTFCVSESRALDTTEYLVHAPMSLLPSNIKLTTIAVDKKASVETVDIQSLPVLSSFTH